MHLGRMSDHPYRMPDAGARIVEVEPGERSKLQHQRPLTSSQRVAGRPGGQDDADPGWYLAYIICDVRG